MNNNQAFFSVIAKATTPMRPFASKIIPGHPAPGEWVGGLRKRSTVSRLAWESRFLPTMTMVRPSYQQLHAWSTATSSGRSIISLSIPEPSLSLVSDLGVGPR